jgi:hypothetical protein
MMPAQTWAQAKRAVFLAAALGGCAALCGCGMPGAPQPPSLNLPNRVGDLSAERAGNQVSLSWTMPLRNTDKLLLKGDVQARVCRRENAAGPCVTAGNVQFAPGADATFTESLPAALAAGGPRGLAYFVELVNHKGRSAGLSNSADVPAGEAPAAVAELHAEMRKDGVLLRWAPGGPDAPQTAIRLERKLLTPLAKPPSGTDASSRADTGPLAPPSEPAVRNLLVAAGAQPGQALDKEIRFGESYQYRAQRVAFVTAGGEKLELAGPLSAPVCIVAENVFPPNAPTGLAAVATVGENGAAPAIDLSWQPGTEADLAGYIVYRLESGATDNGWQRISRAQPVVGPGYHDPDVQAGHTYSYAVSAVDQQGLESARSAETRETVPGP